MVCVCLICFVGCCLCIDFCVVVCWGESGRIWNKIGDDFGGVDNIG